MQSAPSIARVLAAALLVLLCVSPARAAPPAAGAPEGALGPDPVLAPAGGAATEPAAAEPLHSATSDDALALERLSAQLRVFAGQARDTRHFLLISSLGSAAALLPAGIVLSRHDNALQQQVSVGMLVGGAVPLALSFLWRRPSTMERLSSSVEAARSGQPADALLQRIEQLWREAAERARLRREISGRVNLVLDLASTAVGPVFLLAKPFGRMSSNTQYLVGSSLLGPGVPLATGGVRSLLLMQSREESSWESYGAGLAGRRSVLGMAALPHGAGASGQFSF